VTRLGCSWLQGDRVGWFAFETVKEFTCGPVSGVIGGLVLDLLCQVALCVG